MIPGTYALNVYQGDDHAWRFVLWADVAKTTPTDLTGMVVEAEVRDRPGGLQVVPARIVVTLPNTIDMTLNHDDTRSLPLAGRWDLQLTDFGGRVSTILAGPVKLIADITESTPAAGAETRTRGYLTEPVT